MLREELRIISARMRRVPANRRPQYTGLERMAILQLRAMRGWNTIGNESPLPGLRRHDPRLAAPSRRLPHSCKPQPRSIGFRMSCVTPREQIKLFCPTLGKLKIAEKLAWAGMPNLPVAALRTGRENRKERGEQWRRPQESGERRSEFVRLSSLLSPLSCSIAAERQWRRPRRLETGIEIRHPRGTRSRSIDMGFPSSNSHSLPDGEVATHGCPASQVSISLFRA